MAMMLGYVKNRQPRWLSGMMCSHVHSLMISRRSLCPEKLGSNPGQGSKGINFSRWHSIQFNNFIPTFTYMYMYYNRYENKNTLNVETENERS